MSDIGSIIIIAMVFRVLFLMLQTWWEVKAGMTIEEIDNRKVIHQ